MSTQRLSIFVEVKPVESVGHARRTNLQLGRLLKSRPNDPKGTVIKVVLLVDPEDLMPETQAVVGGLKPDIVVQAIKDHDESFSQKT